MRWVANVRPPKWWTCVAPDAPGPCVAAVVMVVVVLGAAVVIVALFVQRLF